MSHEVLAPTLSRLQTLTARIEDELGLDAGSTAAFVTKRGWGAVVAVRASLLRMLSADAVATAVSELAAEIELEAPGALWLVEHDGRAPEQLQAQALAGELQAFARFEQGVRVVEQRRGPSALESELIAIWQDVLQREVPDAETSFFALGGNSLAAAQIGARIQARYARRLPARVMFETPTVRAVAAALESEDEERLAPIALVSREARLPLSAAQARMRFLWQLDPSSAAYDITGALRLRGALDVAALRRALTELVTRHESLRTRFPEHEGVPYQHLDAPAPVELTGDDGPFDLASGPLFRVRLTQVAPDEHVLAVRLHHAIGDGQSMDVMLDELTRLYAGATLEAPTLQYADYARWQSERLAAGEGARQLAYWKQKLGDEHPVLSLPSDRPRPAAQSSRGAVHRFTLPAQLLSRLRTLAEAEQASTFMVLLASFDVLLTRLAGVRALRVGITSQNRVRLEAERLLGCFVNTQVLALDCDAQQSFRAHLAGVKRELLAAQEHQELPFEQLVEALAPERSSAHNPLFQVMFNHQRRARPSLPGLQTELLREDVTSTRFDLSLATEEDDDGSIEASFVYATELFDAARIAGLAERWCTLLGRLLASPERPLGAIDLLAEDERADTHARVEVAHAFVHERIPVSERTALIFDGERMSYRELDARVEALARKLVAHGAGPDVIVGIALPRSFELVTAVLAVLRAGAAYLPLDLEYPDARLDFMVRDAGACLVLSQEARFAVPVLSPRDADEYPAFARPALSPLNLAYVLYTSGTTGTPKAVGNTHAALWQRLSWMQREYELTADETLLHKTPLGFDVSVWELLWPLQHGCALVIAPPDAHRDPRELARLIAAHAVTTVHFVPSLLREFVAQDESLDSLRRVFSGGEALSRELAEAVHARLPGVRLDNRYGPTEALINASYWTSTPSQQGPVPLGRAIPNTSLRVLDGALHAQPPDVPGELFIGGDCLARGYVGRPALTAERFIPDVFASEPGQRMYRAGDLAQRDADGVLAYLGRRDEQVKIRGVRVELGELEGALRADPEVQAAAVIARAAAGGTQLVAYVVPALDVEALRARLASKLPEPLLPAHIVTLEALPRLPSGKLDRAALPAPTSGVRAFLAPRDEHERAVAAIWAEVLQVERVGADDDFFALGGHSLLATQAISRVRRAFSVELPLRALFEAKSLAAFARRVREAEPAVVSVPLTRVDRTQPLPLSYPQERMWVLWRLEPDSAAYNVGGAVRLRGRLDVAALSRALDALLERHESLRTTFPELDARPVQQIGAPAPLALSYLDLRGQDEQAWRREAASEVEQPFDLVHGPVIRARLLALADDEHVLVITLHHIVAEGWAMDVFARECVALYEAFSQGRPSPLQPLAIQYADYAAWQRRWLEAGEAERQLVFWRSTLGTEHPLLALPADRPRPAAQSYRGDYH
ncbi:MAG: amino acid adenylation domain-containing protein, partial [Polyangiales bacterium]